ncbi:hypothetical protein HanXRQr2_Chr14g0665771 [Helianthus annuus]|uniref:Uncharacterized protein n=1 Tax=Helianthus annuus TaxID=4232 RepID=A0A9K3HA95_HELAN|nr:hypothetical protein HanXRQr2_Chr14g0665771 [Helianthus annuus]
MVFYLESKKHCIRFLRKMLWGCVEKIRTDRVLRCVMVVRRCFTGEKGGAFVGVGLPEIRPEKVVGLYFGDRSLERGRLFHLGGYGFGGDEGERIVRNNMFPKISPKIVNT